MTKKLTYERLTELLHYDPETGVFTWLVNIANGKIKAGTVAGSLKPVGYIFIKIDGSMYRAHRLAHFYMTGSLPENDVDHRDLNRSNNRWNNLRPATRSQNACNKSKKPGASGHTGITLTPYGKFRVRVRVGNKRQMLGDYSSITQALSVRRFALADMHGEFARAV